MGKNPQSLLRGLAVWLIIMFVESLHGAAREVWLRPLVGDFRARQFAFFTGIVLIFTITLISVSWLRAVTQQHLLAVGALWAALTLAFEFGLGLFVLGYSWERMWEDYNLARGGLMGLGLLFLLISPWLAAKVRGMVMPQTV